jgi:hypothetical protein
MDLATKMKIASALNEYWRDNVSFRVDGDQQLALHVPFWISITNKDDFAKRNNEVASRVLGYEIDIGHLKIQ